MEPVHRLTKAIMPEQLQPRSILWWEQLRPPKKDRSSHPRGLKDGTHDHKINCEEGEENKGGNMGTNAVFLIFWGTGDTKIKKKKVLLRNKGTRGKFCWEQGNTDPSWDSEPPATRQHIWRQFDHVPSTWRPFLCRRRKRWAFINAFEIVCFSQTWSILL